MPRVSNAMLFVTCVRLNFQEALAEVKALDCVKRVPSSFFFFSVKKTVSIRWKHF